MLLARLEAAGTRSVRTDLAVERVDQLGRVRQRLRPQKIETHVPAVRTADLEHLARQRRELLARLIELFPHRELCRGQALLALIEIGERRLILRPELLEFLAELLVAG